MDKKQKVRLPDSSICGIKNEGYINSKSYQNPVHSLHALRDEPQLESDTRSDGGNSASEDDMTSSSSSDSAGNEESQSEDETSSEESEITLRPNSPDAQLSDSGSSKSSEQQSLGRYANGRQVGHVAKTRDPLAIAVQEIVAPAPSQFPLHSLFAPYDSFNIVVTNPTQGKRKEQAQCWEKLISGENGRVLDTSVEFAVKALVCSDIVSLNGSPAPSSAGVGSMDEGYKCCKTNLLDKDDLNDTGFLFTQGFNKRVERMNMMDLGPSVNTPIRADRLLKRDIYGQRLNIQARYFPDWMKTVDPITIFRRLFLDDDTLRKISDNSNQALQQFDDNVLAVAGHCQALSFEDVEKYFLAAFLMLGADANTKEPQEELTSEFYHLLIMPRDRMCQISHLIRFKDFGQTSDQFISWLNFFINSRLGMLHRRLPRVLSVHTYRVGDTGSSCVAGQQASRTTRRLFVTVARAGYVLFRMQFHHLPEDTQTSGFHSAAGITVLQRLFRGVKLAGRYVVMAGETTLEAAEFFHNRGARFIGSTGPLPASMRLLDNAASQAGLVLPDEPRCTMHFEPVPGLRETILIKPYRIMQGNNLVSGFLKMPRAIVSEPHIYCNIGGGAFVPMKMSQVDRHWPIAMIPLNCFLMMRNKSVNLLYETLCRRDCTFGHCCLSWHQSLMLHALFSGFMACWMCHAAADGQLVSDRQAGQHLLRQVLETAVRRVDERRRYNVFLRVKLELQMMRDALNSRLQQLDSSSTSGAAKRRPRPQATATAQLRCSAGHGQEDKSEADSNGSTALANRVSSRFNNVNLMTRSSVLKGLLNVTNMEQGLEEVGQGSDGDWLRNGIKLPDNAFDDLGRVDEDSSNDDSN